MIFPTGFFGRTSRKKMRRDGTRFLKGFEEAGGVLPFPTPPAISGGGNPPLQKMGVGNAG